jgi:hypothetical protein
LLFLPHFLLLPFFFPFSNFSPNLHVSPSSSFLSHFLFLFAFFLSLPRWEVSLINNISGNRIFFEF